MHFIKKGYALKAMHGGIIGALALVILTALLLIPAHSFAQDKAKPKLIPIQLDQTTNNAEALSIAKKLNRDFFYIDKEYMDGSPNAEYYASFIPLMPEHPKRFIIVTVTDTPYYCTNYGCPYYIYENHTANQWRLVLSLQTQNLWYDANTAGNQPDNIISQVESATGNAVSIWLWAAHSYLKAARQ